MNKNMKQDDVQKIVVIDDDQMIREICSAVLCDTFAITLYESADIAIEKIDKTDLPDVFLVDIVMPGKDGIDFIRWLREQQISRPVIILSGNVEKEHALEALKLGAFAIIEKPFDTITLFLMANRAAAFAFLRETTDDIYDSYYNFLENLLSHLDDVPKDLKALLEGADNKLLELERKKQRLQVLYDVLEKA